VLLPDTSAVVNRVRTSLGAPVHVALVSIAGASETSDSNEATPWAQRVAARRALRVVRLCVGEAGPARLAFPHPCFSVTHAGRVGGAVGCRPGTANGVGVDFEPHRVVDDAIARFFLTASEQAWVASLDRGELSGELLRLWTVKEAVFKADLENHDAMLGDYQLDDPTATTGIARRVRGSKVTRRYTTVTVEGGVLSVAVAPATVYREDLEE
jgi:4'-phosphopantetheinyl transferase EntD